MVKFSKDFFTNGEVLFVGYASNTSKNKMFSREIYNALVKGGLKVMPYNNKENGSYDVKVYSRLSDLPKVPESAFVLLSRDKAKKAVKMLADSGVKRILFQSKRNVDQEMLDECGKMGIETAIACPMMIYGSGLHKLHAFFAGVR
jgi:acyl-CoA synthetase (NDP forming)